MKIISQLTIRTYPPNVLLQKSNQSLHSSLFTFNYLLKRKQCPCKPGSVPLRVSVIYLLCRLPCASSILPSIVFRRTQADNPQTMVYANLQPPDGTALRSPVGWWSLTPPSHPYPYGRSFSSPVSCCHQQLAFSPVERPKLPGLSSRTHRASDRPLHCFQLAKVVQNERKTKYIWIFLSCIHCNATLCTFRSENLNQRLKVRISEEATDLVHGEWPKRQAVAYP